MNLTTLMPKSLCHLRGGSSATGPPIQQGVSGAFCIQVEFQVCNYWRMFTFALITLLLTHFNFSTWEVVLLIKKIKQRLKLDLSKSQFSSSFGPAKCLSNRGTARFHKSLAPRGYRDKSLQIRNRISSQIHPLLTFWHY